MSENVNMQMWYLIIKIFILKSQGVLKGVIDYEFLFFNFS